MSLLAAATVNCKNSSVIHHQTLIIWPTTWTYYWQLLTARSSQQFLWWMVTGPGKVILTQSCDLHWRQLQVHLRLRCCQCSNHGDHWPLQRRLCNHGHQVRSWLCLGNNDSCKASPCMWLMWMGIKLYLWISNQHKVTCKGQLHWHWYSQVAYHQQKTCPWSDSVQLVWLCQGHCNTNFVSSCYCTDLQS